MQLWRLHRSSRIKQPNPQTIMWNDLKTFILKRQSLNEMVVLMMDANSSFEDGDLPMNRLKTICNMRDAHSHLHGNSNTPTYSRGTKKIDYILVSKTLISTNALVRAGTLPLHQGITSNHTLLFINFKEKRLLRASSSKIMSIQSRILSSKNKRSRTKYCHHFLKQKNQRKY